MKTGLVIIVGIVGIALAACPLVVWSQETPAVQGRQYASVAHVVRAIHATSDPGGIMKAYAAGMAIDDNDTSLHWACVYRLVALDMPYMAEQAAKRLTALVPDNALAWAVLAWTAAAEDDMTRAVTQIVTAGQCQQNHAFIARTAGEIFAWYDQQEDKPAIPEVVLAGMAQLRDEWQDIAAYKNSYRQAEAFYAEQDAQDALADAVKRIDQLSGETNWTYNDHEEPTVVYRNVYPAYTTRPTVYLGLWPDESCWAGGTYHSRVVPWRYHRSWPRHYRRWSDRDRNHDRHGDRKDRKKTDRGRTALGTAPTITPTYRDLTTPLPVTVPTPRRRDERLITPRWEPGTSETEGMSPTPRRTNERSITPRITSPQVILGEGPTVPDDDKK